MKPFSLEEYLANPSRKVVTKNGRSVKIICTDRKHSRYPIVALVKSRFTENESIVCYTKEGKFYTGSDLSDEGIFFAPEKHEGWINVYSYPGNNIYAGTRVYNSKEVAEEIGKDQPGYLTTSNIEWEE